MDRGDEREASGPRLPEARPRRAGSLGTVLALSSLPVVAVAVAAITGLGLARNLPSVPALAGGLALVLLPILGLASLVRGGARLAETGGCAWFWSLTVLLAMPFYFPGERADSVRSGLAYLTAPVSQESGSGVVRMGERLVELLGDEPEPTPFATPLPVVEATRLSKDVGRVRESGDVVIPYEGQGESMRVAAFFDGPRYGEEFTMIFDTGATYTTLDRAALATLEVPVPADAPTAVLRTANGEVEAPLVLVDAVWLGDAVVEWVTIAVCDTCASEGVSGLLGLNVTGQFQVSLDHERQEILLGALAGDENRKLDVGQWLGLESRLLRWQDGRLEVELTGSNRAPVPIASLAAEVECPGGRFEVSLESVQPQDSATRRVALPRGTDCSEYSVSLRRATWDSDRFR